MQVAVRNPGAQHGPASDDKGQESAGADASSDPRHVRYCTAAGPINVQGAYRALKRDDLVGNAAKAARAGKCDMGQVAHIATGLAGAQARGERKLGLALLHIASPEDVYARCNLAQEYARGGNLPQDLDFAEELFRSVVAEIPADQVPLGTFARRGLADLLVERGRADEARAIWEEIARFDKEAAYLAGCAYEQVAVASGSGLDLERVAGFYRLAAIAGHVGAMLALARVFISEAGTTQAARDEAQLWLLRANQEGRQPAGVAPQAAARNEHQAGE